MAQLGGSLWHGPLNLMQPSVIQVVAFNCFSIILFNKCYKPLYKVCLSACVWWFTYVNYIHQVYKIIFLMFLHFSTICPLLWCVFSLCDYDMFMFLLLCIFINALSFPVSPPESLLHCHHANGQGCRHQRGGQANIQRKRQ